MIVKKQTITSQGVYCKPDLERDEREIVMTEIQS